MGNINIITVITISDAAKNTSINDKYVNYFPILEQTIVQSQINIDTHYQYSMKERNGMRQHQYFENLINLSHFISLYSTLYISIKPNIS